MACTMFLLRIKYFWIETLYYPIWGYWISDIPQETSGNTLTYPHVEAPGASTWSIQQFLRHFQSDDRLTSDQLVHGSHGRGHTESLLRLWNPVSVLVFAEYLTESLSSPSTFWYLQQSVGEWAIDSFRFSIVISRCWRISGRVSEGCLGRYLRGVSGGVWGLAVGCLECQSCKSFQFYQSCSWSDCSQRFVLHLNLCRRVLANPQTPFQALPILQSFQSFQSYWVLLRYFI